MFDSDPPGTVRRCSRHPAWLPFADGEDGNFLAVDMAPARNGTPGQIIAVGRDYNRGPVYVTDSITSLLGHYLHLLEQGDFDAEEPFPLPEPDHVLGPREAGNEALTAAAPTVQTVRINDAAGPVDLSALAAAPRLRRLQLNRSSTADLAPLRTLPVESVDLTLEGGDLTPLEGHRHLTLVDLATAAPVDIAPLRTVSNLRCVDLTRADVADLSVLADFSELRYLALTSGQWAVLLEEGAVPPRLAAARLADKEVPLDEALAWAQRLGLETADAIRITGHWMPAAASPPRFPWPTRPARSRLSKTCWAPSTSPEP